MKRQGQRVSQEERREQTRRNILGAAMELFFTKGYEETTTRDIVLKAGILNGSLYNRFKSKEEILLSLLNEGISEFLDESGPIFSEDKDPVAAFIMPGAAAIYVSSRSRKAAGIVCAAQGSWTAVSSFSESYLDWVSSLLGRPVSSLPGDGDTVPKAFLIMGAAGNMASLYANGLRPAFEDVLTDYVKIVSSVTGLPVFDVKGLVQKISGILAGKDVVILGHRLSDFADYTV